MVRLRALRLVRSAAIAGLLVLAGCSTAASPTPSASPSPTPSPTPEPTASPTPEPTATPSPTASPGPTPVAEQNLTVDLSLTYVRGTIEGPGRCDIGQNGIWIYLEHRQGGNLDAYITVGPAAGGISGPPVTGGGTFGPEAVRIRVHDPSSGQFVDTVDAQAEVAPDLKSGTFGGTWNGETLLGDYTCS